MKTAILGATSHIAQNLSSLWGLGGELFLFSRAPNRVLELIEMDNPVFRNAKNLELSDFPISREGFDVVINCIGFGTPNKVRAAGAEIYFVTEYYDNMVLEYIRKNPGTIYINFSSGAVFGSELARPISEVSDFRIPMNGLSVSDSYRISKFYSEAKHRALPDYRIIDFRIFSFFSKYIDLSSPFLLSEMVRSVKNGTTFETTTDDLVRDFVSPEDLSSLVASCITRLSTNGGFDVYSQAPVYKHELISAFIERYGLKVDYTGRDVTVSPTGIKNQYYSLDRRAGSTFGYVPRLTSMDTVIAETDALLGIKIN